MTDARMAAAMMSKAHNMSDSDDSDATIEPPDYSGSLDGSQDLFDTTGSSSSSFTSSRLSSSSVGKNRQTVASSKSSSPAKSRMNSLSKKVSRTHEISDNESDSVEDTKCAKQAVGLGHRDGSSGRVSSPKASPKPKANSLSKKLSKTHALSDCEDDTGQDSKLSPSGGNFRLKGSCKSNAGGSVSFPQTSNSVSRQSSTLSSTLSHSDRKNVIKNAGSASKLMQSKPTQRSCDTSHRDEERSSQRPRQVCKYGDRCYRTNPDHFQDFDHEGEKNGKRKNTSHLDIAADASKRSKKEEKAGTSDGQQDKEDSGSFMKTVADVVCEFQPLSLFLTKVSGIDNKFNRTGAVSLKDILSPLMGNLQASCQFNFMTDIPWLVEQYPKQFRSKPLLLVHGEQGRSETELKEDGAPYPHISFCRAKLEMMYGTHHTKMMMLLYDCGMRVVIHTANLISGDWHQKTQGVWISPLFPKLPCQDTASAGKGVQGDSPSRFKADLLAYLAAYRAVPLTPWEKHIQQHDMSSASVYLIGSVPGRHAGQQKSAWGHLKLRKVLQESGPKKEAVSSWPVIGQFSSIGSLGTSPDQWLCNEWLGSLSQCQGVMGTPLHSSKLQLVYPSKENVRLCLEGYAGGGCLPYSIKTAQKQIYLNNFVRKWGSEGRGRTLAIPHIKTYTRVSPDYSQAAWFLVTSANLSKAAWGALEKQKTQLMIRSYEIGVLFLPKCFGVGGSFPVARAAEEVTRSQEVMLPFPYDLPPPTYQKGDRIWMWDVPCVDLPDTHGKKYCPRL